MSKVRFFVTLAAVLLLVTSFTFAHDGDEHHTMKIRLGEGMEAVEIGDLEVGETRQLYTDSGKEVVVTREEHGFNLTVDGKEIDILSGGRHQASVITLGDHDDAGKIEVRVKDLSFGEPGEDDVVFFSGDADGEHKASVFVVRGDEGEHGEHGEHGYAWVQGDEDAVQRHVSYVVRGKSVLDEVLDSKVLDQLDEATRQEIIDVIKKAEKPHVKSFRGGLRTIVIDTDEHGEDHDE